MVKLTGPKLIDDAKIRDYLLNPHHFEGKSKAKFFLARGFERDKAALLAQALYKHALDHDVAFTQTTPRGVKSILRCSIETPDGRNPCILAIWIMDNGDPTTLRFVTARPYKQPPAERR